MKSRYLLPFALLPLLTACDEGPKKVDYPLTVQLALSQALPGKAGEPLPVEFSDWFKPFSDDQACPGVRVYPNVEGLRLDLSPVAVTPLTTLDPKDIAKEQVSGVQAFLGVKPKFDKMTEVAEARIKAVKLPARMTQTSGDAAVADAELKRTLARKPGAILVGAADIAAANARATALKAGYAADAAPALQAVASPGEMRAAVLKTLCQAMQKKEKGRSVLLLDAGLFAPLAVVDTGNTTPGTPPPEVPATAPAGNAAEAKQALDRALHFLELARANDGLRRDRQRRALGELDTAIAADPKLGLAYLNRGSVQRQLGNPDAAAADLEKAAGLMPKDSGPHLELAIVRAQRKDTGAALEELDRAFALGFKMVEEIRREPALKAVVRDPRFDTLLVQHGFK